MKQSLIVLVLFTLFNLKSYCQGNKQYPGYIITNSDSKIEGIIKDLDWSLTPNEIEFKSASDIDFKKYNNKDIKGFYASGSNRTFISSTVEINTSSHKTEKLSISKQAEMKPAHLFLEQLFEGSIYSLYKHVDIENQAHFFIQNDEATPPIELIQHKYADFSRDNASTTSGRSNNTINISNKYIGQLSYYFNDCNDISNKINQSRYSNNSLISLFKAYHECKEANYLVVKVDKVAPIKLAIYGGLTLSKLRFKGDSPYLYSQAFTESPIGIALGPNLGVDLEMGTKGKHELLSFYIGLNYYARKISDEGNYARDGIVGTINHDIQLDITSHYIDFTTGIGFTFLHKKKVNPFFKIGIASNLNISNKAVLIDNQTSSISPNITNETMPRFVNDGQHTKWVIAPTFALGVNIDNFFVSANLLYNYRGYTDVLSVKTSQINIFINAGYKFILNKKKLEVKI